MSARHHLTQDLLWSVVFLDLGVVAAWAGKWWWFGVLIFLASALSFAWLR